MVDLFHIAFLRGFIGYLFFTMDRPALGWVWIAVCIVGLIFDLATR